MTAQTIKVNNLYFYFFLVMPLIVPICYYFINDDISAYIIFYTAAFACAFFDQKEMVKSEHESKSQLVASVLGIVIFPPIYVYGRTNASGMKKWRWFFVYIAIVLASVFTSAAIEASMSLKTTACEITTSIFKDKGTDTRCIIVKDLETVSSGYYRAKAVLTNGVDVPITIEEREDNYIYVTLAPLSNLFD
ncbi:hypothetical protein BSK71_13020 [Pectobacterium actinidiae]|uniref:Uncharacterized protein n=1 Tax=Pectobacterium actinidiae TaxID=1507808 RepID=A0A1V2R2I2_9GAMM|nr:hypothetical protein [Pectobacterium actinidiae]MDY4313783.1 hypothetical protein [Pectobacterium actinidiae]ONK03613.1 hypothetical protein BSK69_13075 [Pectobacterium actinidiae]ONK05342.1 hypothetical protein BSK71_13020 [Pectobacterium actinidiae]